jgi:hypothetical protein
MMRGIEKKAARLLWTAVLATALTAPLMAATPGHESADEGATRRLALVIGSHDGGEGRERLVYAGSDAAAFRRTLEELGGLRDGDATLLIDPDSLRLIKALDDMEDHVRMLKRAGAHVEALVYYSGHANEKGLLLGPQAFDYRVFRDRMNTLGADVRIAVVDACESGALTRMKGGHTAPAFLVDRSTRSEGYAILTSSSESEAAQESDRVGGSFFTNALNSGLRGAADASRDGKVTLHEAYQFAYDETLARTQATRGGPQHAGYDIQLNGSGDVVLTDIRQASAFMDLSEDVAGRLFIRDSTDRLTAEVQKPAGRDMRMGLSAGTYEVRLLRNGVWKAATVTLEDGKATTVVPATFKFTGNEPSAGNEPVAPPPDSSVITVETDSTGFHYVHDEGMGGFSSRALFDQQSQDWHGTEFGLFATDAVHNLHGGQIAIGANVTRGDLQGYQISVITNTVGGSLHGFQFSEINVVSDNLTGAQLSPLIGIVGDKAMGSQFAGLFNIAGGGLNGFQGAGVFGVSGESSQGLQLAGVANFTADNLRGMQVAGVTNFTGDFSNGLQLAGVANWAGERVRGGQVAGVANVSGPLRGFQLAPLVNVAGKVNGYQIGLINISDDYESGAPIGLINVSRKGRFEVESWLEETGLVFTGLRTGAGWMHSQLALGVNSRGEQRMLAPTFGLSGEYAFQGTPLFWENGFLYSALFSLDKYPMKNIIIESDWARVRTGLGIRPLSFLTIVGGLSYNVNLHPYADVPITGNNYRYFQTYGDVVSLWPGAWVGVRIGR